MSETPIRYPDPPDRDDEQAAPLPLDASTDGVELLVGRVVDVLDHPGARAPSFLLRVDLGARGEREAQMEPGSYGRDELLGRLVVVSLAEAAIVVAARSHANGPVLVQPAQDVEPGTVVA